MRAPMLCLLFLVLCAPAGAASSPPIAIHVTRSDGSEHRQLAGTGFDLAPAWSPDGSRIAFFGEEGIYATAPDGTGLTRLARVEDSTSDLAWSPDGTRIAFATAGRLMIMGMDGTAARALATNVNEHFATPSWSPDGTRLTFVRGENERSALSVVGADGSGLRTIRRIRLDSNEGGVPAWSPDGASIAFVHPSRGRFAVFIVRPDGTGLRKLNRRCTFAPAWAPDGRRLACVAVRRSGTTLDIVGVDGTVQRVLARVGRRRELHAPAWSPDGARLSYVVRRRDLDFSAHVVGVDGANKRRVAAVPFPTPVTWSPDGTRIAFGAGRE